jgi:hypothetical protein
MSGPRTAQITQIRAIIGYGAKTKTADHNGALCAGARGLRWLSVTGFPVSFRPRLESS